MAWISFEIKICEVSDDYNTKQIKGKEKMIINDIEYNFIKKCLNNEYGIEHEFNELDDEVLRVANEFELNKRQGIIFKSKNELISHLRKNGDKIYNEASDEYLIDESFEQGYLDTDYYNETGNYKLLSIK